MAEYGGLLLIIDDAGMAREIDRETERGRFSMALSAADWELGQRELALISFDGVHLHAAALAVRGQRVGTAQRTVEFSNALRLADQLPTSPESEPPSFDDGFYARVDHPALELDTIERALLARISAHFRRSRQGGGKRVPPATWRSLLDHLKSLDSSLAEELGKLERHRTVTREHYTNPAFETVAEEKDAVTLALKLAGFDQRLVGSAFEMPLPDALCSIFAGVREAYLREDAMVAHDASIVPGWEFLQRNQVGEAFFQRRGHVLHVMNVNRHPIEQALGVDLFYYHEQFDLFVMVQYKRMEWESGDPGGWWYRPDQYCDDELARMTAAVRVPADWHACEPGCFRLTDNPFFFKLCQSVAFDPLGTSLVEGFYVPIVQWQLVLDSARGPRGGRRIGYGNVDRRLTNSNFIGLVSSGLVGSRGERTQQLMEVVQAAVSAGRDVVVAAHRTVQRGRAAARPAGPFDGPVVEGEAFW